jgi:hypothetical protein
MNCWQNANASAVESSGLGTETRMMMNDNETRLLATFFIWLAFTVTMIASMVTNLARDSGGFFLIGFMIFVIGAVVATQAVWKYGSAGASPQTTEKAKRRTQVDRLLERMDEGELDELRNRLLSEADGEAVSLNELLAERERQRR